MKNRILITLIIILCKVVLVNAQDVSIDGRLQPLLNDFFTKCKEYDITYYDKLFKLKSIDIVNTLTVSEKASTLGMLRRNKEGKVVSIDINWVAQLDKEILKVVAFHEFAHYFLEYETHVCDDCGHIMSVVNSDYFSIANDWENKLKQLFEESPAYAKKMSLAFVNHKQEK